MENTDKPVPVERSERTAVGSSRAGDGVYVKAGSGGASAPLQLSLQPCFPHLTLNEPDFFFVCFFLYTLMALSLTLCL